MKDWELVKELLYQYLNRITDIRTLSEDELKLDMNAVFAGRMTAYKELVSFLNSVDLLGDKKQVSEENFE